MARSGRRDKHFLDSFAMKSVIAHRGRFSCARLVSPVLDGSVRQKKSGRSLGWRLQLTNTRVWFATGGLIASISIAPACSQESNIPEGFVLVKDVVPSIVLDMRYYHGHNFIGRQIDGYLAPKSYLTRPAAMALKLVQDELMELGLSLKIYDAYRPQRAVNEFIEWAENLDDTAAKAEFYPDLSKSMLFDECYIAARSGHTRGSTLDLTIVPYPPPDEPDWSAQNQQSCKLPADQRFADNSLDMGVGYDCFDTLSWTDDDRIGPSQRAHRLLLKSLMEKHGFQNYPREWWHYSLVDEPFPDTYFDFPIR